MRLWPICMRPGHPLNVGLNRIRSLQKCDKPKLGEKMMSEPEPEQHLETATNKRRSSRPPRAQSPVAEVEIAPSVTQAERHSPPPEKLGLGKPTTPETTTPSLPTITTKRTLLKTFQDIALYWTRTSTDFMTPSETVTTTLDRKKRIAAGGLGALSVHSAIDISQISYTLRPNIEPITSTDAMIATLIVAYWTVFSCVLF